MPAGRARGWGQQHVQPRGWSGHCTCGGDAALKRRRGNRAQACYKAIAEAGTSKVKHLERGVYGW